MKDLKTCLKGLWNMSSPYRGLMLTTVFVGTLRICCSLTFVWVCKRLIDIVRPSQKTVEALTGLELPAGVEIAIKL